MSCNTCSKSFSLMRREKGCPNCGFSYCSKCLENKIFVTKLNTQAKVCAKCIKAISSNEKPVIHPPDSYFKRLAEINNTSNQGNSKTPDDEIAERLNKLKEDKKEKTIPKEEEIAQRLQKIKGEIPSTSEAELRSRLARLKGVPHVVSQAKPVLPPPDLRTEQEQADDLLKQYMEQTNIDTKYKDEFDELVHDMESRVTKLKGANPPNLQSTTDHIDSEDEEETVNKILQKVKKEITLEENEISPPTNDELPFCEICNEDARMRCLGCRYLFCKRCYNEHKDDDDGCNRYEPYEAPKGCQY